MPMTDHPTPSPLDAIEARLLELHPWAKNQLSWDPKAPTLAEVKSDIECLLAIARAAEQLCSQTMQVSAYMTEQPKGYVEALRRRLRGE